MNRPFSKKRNFMRMTVNILSILVMLAMAFPAMESAQAQETALPEGWHDGTEGTVNAASCTAFGWAVDPDDRDRDLQVQILADGEPVATTTANLLREDVGACTEGTCGFGVNLWGLVSAGVEHLITARAYDEETQAWVDLSGTPKTLTCWGYPEGFHDGMEGDVDINSCTAFGWAADPDDRDRDVQVRVLSDGIEVATRAASDYGQDMEENGICPEGTCRFSASLWGLISPYEEHQIAIQAYDEEMEAWRDLDGTPKALTCRTYDIYVFDTQTGETRQLTNLTDSYEYNPRWSPDGTKIVHDAWSIDWSSHAVTITDVKSGVSIPLAGAESGSYPIWSPNGKWIAFDRGADNDYRIFIIPPTGGEPTLVSEDAFMASWSPDSKRLAFHQPSDGSVHTIELKTGGKTLVATNGNAPAWSPDGDWIAFERDGNIWKVNVDKGGNPIGNPIQLTHSPLFEARPSWSNNNKTIAFHAGMGQDTDIWTIPASGGIATWLTGAPVFGDYDPNYSFNGRYISYSSFSPDGQAARSWVSPYIYDLPGYWEEGTHVYHYEAEWQSGSEITPEMSFNVSGEASFHPEYALLRPYAVRVGPYCQAIDAIRPDQPTRFLSGYVTDTPMTYSEAVAYYGSLTARAVWDDGQIAELMRHEIIPYSEGDWFNYVCTFTEAPPEPVLYIHYEYPDVVEGDYELGHTVQVTVFDSDGNTKATATVETMEMPHWGGAPGFRVEQWDGMEGPPDILPGDVVRAVVDGGPLTVETRVGEIAGMIDLDTNSITGTINAPWAGDLVNVMCSAWGAPGGASDKETTVTPDGVSQFTCTWDSSEWDIQPGETVGVSYWGNDMHSVANAISNPWLLAFPKVDQIFGYGWPVGSEVSLTINDQQIATVPVEGAPWNENDIMAYFDFGAQHDLAAGDVVTLSGSGMVRTHAVQNLDVTDISMDTDTVSGTADTGASVHAWVHEFGHDVQVDVADGTWSAYFGGDDFHLRPTMCGRAEIRVEGNNSTNVDWCVPNPKFGVRANVDQIEAWEWNIGETVTLTIDNPGTSASPDFTDTRTIEPASWDPHQTYASFNLWNVYDIQPEDVVSLSNGPITKTTTVTNLAFTDIDVEHNVVTGMAAPDSRVDVWACDNVTCINRHINAGGTGLWTADFGNFGDEDDEQNTFDLIPGTWIDSSQTDEDSDQTYWGERVLNPYVEAAPYSDWIHAREWPIGTLMTLEIDDPSNGLGDVDYSATATMQQAPWNPNDPNDIVADFRWPDEFAPGPGYVLTMSGDNGQSKSLTITDLRMTGFDLDLDTISGTGTPNAQIQVCANLPNRCITRWVTADGESNWTANYGVPGTGNDDPDTFDVQQGSNGWAAEYDEDSDRTWFDWWVPNPRMTVFPEWEWFDGMDWPDGATVNISVTAKPQCTTSKVSSGYFFNGSFGEDCDLAIGDEVTFSDGTTTRTHIVQSLTILEVDEAANTVAGTAVPGTSVHVWPHGYNELIPNADDDGNWLADFDDLGIDLVLGMGGRSEIRDEVGNATAVDWYIPNPRIVASITEDWFFVNDFAPNTELAFAVYASEGGALISEGTTPPTDGSGYVWINAEDRWNLEPGNYLTVTDGSSTKDLVIEAFTFDSFDLINGQLKGTIPGSSGREVWAGIGWTDQDAWTMTVTTDTNGAWLADFNSPVPADYWWVAAQIYDADGDASELRPAQIIQE